MGSFPCRVTKIPHAAQHGWGEKFLSGLEYLATRSFPAPSFVLKENTKATHMAKKSSLEK